MCHAQACRSPSRNAESYQIGHGDHCLVSMVALPRSSSSMSFRSCFSLMVCPSMKAIVLLLANAALFITRRQYTFGRSARYFFARMTAVAFCVVLCRLIVSSNPCLRRDVGARNQKAPPLSLPRCVCSTANMHWMRCTPALEKTGEARRPR